VNFNKDIFTKVRISVFILVICTVVQEKTKQVYVIIVGFEIHIFDTMSNKENSCGQAYVCVCVCVYVHTRACTFVCMCEIPYSVSSITV